MNFELFSLTQENLKIFPIFLQNIQEETFFQLRHETDDFLAKKNFVERTLFFCY